MAGRADRDLCIEQCTLIALKNWQIKSEVRQAMTARLFSFMGGDTGLWQITSMQTHLGEPLPAVRRLDITSNNHDSTPQATWILRGITSNERYVTRTEHDEIVAKQLALGRPELTCAALIALRKNPAWWALSQDERLHIFKEQSQHTRIGLQQFASLPRRLHHCRDLAEPQPFDFMTWFEFTPAEVPTFNLLLAQLRAIPEWQYVEREVELRCVREDNQK